MLENCFYVAVGILTVAAILLLIMLVIAGVVWFIKRLVHFAVLGAHKIMCRCGYHYVKWYGDGQHYYCIYCYEKFCWRRNDKNDYVLPSKNTWAYFSEKTGECCHHIKEV